MAGIKLLIFDILYEINRDKAGKKRKKREEIGKISKMIKNAAGIRRERASCSGGGQREKKTSPLIA